MKASLLGLLIASVLGSNAIAASKVCFGSTNNDETKGKVVLAKVTRKQVTLKSKEDGLNGTYESLGTKVNGRDGKTYLEYKGETTDYQEVIMADQDLLHTGTTGLLQFRARGEGFFNSVFFCKDNE